MLQRQVIDVQVGQGVDESTGAPNKLPGKMDVVTNARFVKAGTIEPRPGFPALTRTVYNGTEIDAGHRILATGTELLVSDGDRVYDYLDGQASWQEVDDIPEATIVDRSTGIRGAGTLFAYWDAIETPTVKVIAYVETDDGSGSDNCYPVRVRLIDKARGSQYWELTTWAAAAQQIRLVVCGTNVFVVYVFRNASHEYTIRAYRYNTTTGWGTSYELAGNEYDALGGCWDAHGTATHLWIAYSAYAGTIAHHVWDGLRVRKFLASDCSLVGYNDIGTESVKGPVAIHAINASRTYVAYTINGTSATGIKAAALAESTIALVWSEVVVEPDPYDGTDIVCTRLSICYYSSATDPLWIAYTLQHPSKYPCQTRVKIVDSTGALQTTVGRTYRAELISRLAYLFDTLGGFYCLLGMPSKDYVSLNDPTGQILTQYCGWLVKLAVGASGDRAPAVPARAVCRVALSQHGHLVAGNLPVNLYRNTGDNTFGAGVPILSNGRHPLAASTGDQYPRLTEGCDLYTFKLYPPTTPLSIQAGPEMVLSGGVPVAWDGIRLAEVGFNHAPLIRMEDHVVGGYLTEGGTYQYVAVYQVIDAKGVIQRSCPSAIMSTGALPAGEKTVELEISWIGLTSHHDDENSTNMVRIALYRTVSGGSIFHLVDLLEPDGVDTDYPNVAYVAFSDGLDSSNADTVIANNAILYTDGGVVENLPPPCARHIAYHDSRIWVVSADDPDTVWFSKLHLAGELPGFYEGFRLQIPSGGKIEAIVGWDEKLILFCESSIWLVFGSGPNDLGQGSQYTDPPRLHNGEIGCVDPRSLVHSPTGIYFQSRAGLFQMNGSLAPAFIGAPVEDKLASYPTVVGSCHIERDNEVRFLCQTADLPNVVIVHNYLLDQWSYWYPLDSNGNCAELVSICAAPYDGQQVSHILSDWGEVIRESPGLFIDADASTVELALETAWIHLASIQGYQRIRQISVLGECVAEHDLTLELLFDYDTTSTASYSYSWTGTELAALLKGNREQVQVHVPRQKCESIKLRINTANGKGGGLRLTGLSFEVGVQKGQYKMPPANRPPTAGQPGT